MDRKIACLLVLIMVFTSLPFTSFAEGQDKGLREAIIRCKELFNIGNEYDNFSPEVSSRDGKSLYYLNWSGSKDKLGSIRVAILEDGTVLSYSKWTPSYGDRKPQLAKISKEEGLKLAQNFIKKVSPDFVNNIRYEAADQPLDINANGYNYRLIREENGVPYYNNNLDIYINNMTGEVEDYYSNWDLDLKFPSKEDIISLDQAEELYREKIGLELIYRTIYPDRKPESFLVYGPLYTSHNLDAKSGELVYASSYYYREEAKDMGAMVDMAVEEELSPEETDALDNISGLISKARAEKLARDILALDEDYELTNANLYPIWEAPKKYSWRLGFRKNTEDYYYHASIGLDAKSEELMAFYQDEPRDPKAEINYTRDQALKIAEDYIKKMSIDKFDKLELDVNPTIEETGKEQRTYNFNFRRKLNQAYVDADYIFLVVDGNTGKIREYNMNWTEGNFPARDKLLPIDKAYEILFKDIGLELKYIYDDSYDGVTEKDRQALLVYGLKSDKPANIAANTGKILTSRGEDYQAPSVIKYKDIEDSYAKDKIEVLAQYGIALAGENFRPNDKMNQRDFLYLLAKSKSPYRDLDKSDKELYKFLANEGIIKEGEEAPEKIISKEEGVKYIIRALKYDKLADLDEIYKDIFTDTEDIEAGLKGYVALAYGLKIVEGNEGKFNPKAELKREDGANMIYNYLFSGH